MNQAAINRLWEYAKNPEFVYYLEVVIPRWLSYMPQGRNYEMTRTIEELSTKFYEECVVITGLAMELGILIDGFPRGGATYKSPEALARKYSLESNRRHIVKHWKDHLRTLGLQVDESTYLVYTWGEEEFWAKEWAHFLESTRTLYPVEETADVE